MSHPRPLSPHLQVYRWQITMLMSISHRATGIALSAGSLLLVYWLWALAAGPECFATASALFGSVLGQLVLFGFSAALFYHLCNGIRHLLWDAGYAMSISDIHTTGRIVLVATAVLTLLAWGVGLAMR
jgi:succinate dehydrogenase / fumarate reductase, cytochrome b subunit